MPAPSSSATTRSRWRGPLAAVLLILAGFALLLALFPWDWLRGPLNRYISERTGRHFEITERLDVQLGRRVRVIADGLVFSNPGWAVEPHLVQAERAEVEVKLWPLLTQRRLEVPWVSLRQPRLGLEMLPDGRRSWALDSEGATNRTIVVDALEIDRGRLRFIAPQYGADIRADFVLAAQPPAGVDTLLPLSFRGGGHWRGESFVAEGRVGNVLALRHAQNEPFPIEIFATSGKTSVRAAGRLESLAGFDGADLSVALRGPNLAELRAVLGVALPPTSPYVVEARLQRSGPRWRASELRGTLGRSDLRGELSYDTSAAKPELVAVLRSNRLDFSDLAPLAGAKPTAAPTRRAVPAAKGETRVLPQAPIDVSGLRRINADIRFAAERIVDAHPLPLERLNMHVRVQDGVLQIDPLDVGLAGGRLMGSFRLDGRSQPAKALLELQARGLNVDRLFEWPDLNSASIGQVHARLELSGQGDSLAGMLATASGELVLLMGRGRISNLLLEYAGLDGGEIIQFMMGRDRRVELRCAAAGFDVRRGVMTSRALVLDTADTVIYGQGAIYLGEERLDLVFRPYPKDASILALRSPLTLTGTFGSPDAGIDRSSLIARAGAAIALGMINPLLGLAATIETGPGQNADCTAVLRQASTPQPASKSEPGTRSGPKSEPKPGPGSEPVQRAPASRP